jgi:AcrR family transcriptional regulator
VSPERLTARQAAAEQTRQKLLAAAVAEFSQRPYDEVTVAGIARTAGVAHGLVSHHFQGKQGAYAAAVDAVYEQLRDAQGAQADGPAGEQLRARFRAFLTFVAANPDTALNLVLSTGRDAAFVVNREHGLRMIAGFLGLDLAHPAVGTALHSYADAAEGLSAEWLRRGTPFSVAAMAEAFTALLAGALRAAQALDPALDLADALNHL